MSSAPMGGVLAPHVEIEHAIFFHDPSRLRCLSRGGITEQDKIERLFLLHYGASVTASAFAISCVTASGGGVRRSQKNALRFSNNRGPGSSRARLIEAKLDELARIVFPSFDLGTLYETIHRRIVRQGKKDRRCANPAVGFQEIHQIFRLRETPRNTIENDPFVFWHSRISFSTIPSMVASSSSFP